MGCCVVGPGPVRGALSPWVNVFADFGVVRVGAHLADRTVHGGAGYRCCIVGGALAIHACYAYWRNWIAGAGFQGILAIIALLVGFSTMSGSGDGASPPASPFPLHVTTTGGGSYCYSGGQCYINGEPVSGHP